MTVQVTSTSSATGTSTAAASATSNTKSSTLDYNSFLTLLVTELKNQDPTKPLDATQTVSQLASFSAVEQAVQTNSTLKSILSSATLSQAESYIGKTVKSADGSISGVVVSVTTTDSGQTANLSNGQTISLTTGITVS